MFSLDSVTEYQIEVTSFCNAACPQCPRNFNGFGVNPYMPLQHLSRKVLSKTFTKDIVSRCHQIFFCGSYGDPIMHPDFLDILADFRQLNETVWLYIHTNGGAHDPEYFKELASIINGYGRIDFGIDGLETLQMYRRNVKIDRVLNNAEAFIQAGGKAHWNYIVFEHNQHEIESAKDMAKKLGFENIVFRNTGRFLDHSTMEEMPQWQVAQANYVLRPTTLDQYRNRSIQNSNKVAKTKTQWHEYFNTTKIQCDALLGNKVAINCEGLVLPCNFFNHNLYDARFRNTDYLPRANDLSFVNGKNSVRAFLESYGLDNLNIENKTLKEIFANTMWQDLIASWHKDLDHGRLFECAMTCGEKFTKVWDQTPI